MTITVTELRANFGKYLKMAAAKEIYITNHGKVIAKLGCPTQNRSGSAESRTR